MAIEKSKLVFLALAFACLMQNAAAAPSPLAGGDKYAPPPEFEIIGRAFSEIAKSFSEFVKSVGAILTHALSEGTARIGLPIYLKAHLMLTASGVHDSMLAFTQDQHFDYRVFASTMMRLRQKVDVMERFDEVFESIMAEASITFLNAPVRDKSPNDVLTRLILGFKETADRRLRQHPELKEVYLRTRDIVRVEETSIVPFVFDSSKMSGQRLLEILPEKVKTKMLTMGVNKQFLHHIYNRVTILKKEYFVMARSTLLMAKNGKIELVQQVYDKTLSQVSKFLDPMTADVFDMSKGLFKELKMNFEANPALNQEWRETQKSVAQRHDWDRSIWDLDLIPL